MDRGPDHGPCFEMVGTDVQSLGSDQEEQGIIIRCKDEESRNLCLKTIHGETERIKNMMVDLEFPRGRPVSS